ncbi:MAG: septum formation protein Maf [Firmicutes bacterium]|nr:septum formation protein Maf [Bacillota bacterium]
MNLILASASPRRRELLQQITPNFDVFPAAVDESPGPLQVPGLYALDTASAKAKFISDQNPEALVFGADTIVCLGTKIFGKPRDSIENYNMLMQFSNRQHVVGTAVVIARAGEILNREFVVTKVLFRKLSAKEVNEYSASGNGLDKAGGYGIQDKAGKFVEAIDGCYYNVVGLPLATTARLLEGYI